LLCVLRCENYERRGLVPEPSGGSRVTPTSGTGPSDPGSIANRLAHGEGWRQWWLDNFVRSSFWKAARARFMAPLCQRTLPLSLWLSFELEERQRLLAVLQFLKPITTPTAWKEFAVALHLNRRLWQFTALNSALTQFWCTCGTFGPFALALYHQLLLQNLHVQCISMILRPHPGRRYCWHAGCER
jgi:hypothetical protein